MVQRYRKAVRSLWANGYTVTELVVVLGVLAISSTIALPSFVSYLQTSNLRRGAEELQGLMNVARSLAIKENAWVCVVRGTANPNTNRVRLLISNVSANAACNAVGNYYGLTAHGSDYRVGANGWIRLDNDVLVVAANNNVVFNSIGAAVQAGTFTVRRTPAGTPTMSVVVAASGRVTITAP